MSISRFERYQHESGGMSESSGMFQQDTVEWRGNYKTNTRHMEESWIPLYLCLLYIFIYMYKRAGRTGLCSPGKRFVWSLCAGQTSLKSPVTSSLHCCCLPLKTCSVIGRLVCDFSFFSEHKSRIVLIVLQHVTRTVELTTQNRSSHLPPFFLHSNQICLT